MVETMHATEAMLYTVWLHEQYRAATGAESAITDHERGMQRRWQIKEIRRGRDFVAEWRATRRASRETPT